MPTVHPFRPFLLCLLLGTVLAGAGVRAQAQPAPNANERMSQQLREAIERANAQRPAPATRPARAAASAAPPPTPSVTVNVGQGGALRVAPTPPVPPASRPAATAVAQDEVPSRRSASAPVPAAAPAAAPPRPVVARPSDRLSEAQVQRQYERSRAIALGLPIPAQARLPRDGAGPAPRTEVPAAPIDWSYGGAGGPQAWANLKPEYQLCGSGQRQSPIHIEESAALQGPNETLGFDYRPSSGIVLNDGRTLRVEVQGENLLTVRGSSYRLEYFDFQHPAGEMVNHAGFAMGVHLVHRNAQGQAAIVAVLLQPGDESAFIDKIWTYVPLDQGDRVGMPAGWFDVATLLPQDQRYYQFFGSLTQPPCTEGVLWMVLKQPVTLSAAQLRLFTQMFPANARPVQALNGRIVRDAQ